MKMGEASTLAPTPRICTGGVSIRGFIDSSQFLSAEEVNWHCFICGYFFD